MFIELLDKIDKAMTVLGYEDYSFSCYPNSEHTEYRIKITIYPSGWYPKEVIFHLNRELANKSKIDMVDFMIDEMIGKLQRDKEDKRATGWAEAATKTAEISQSSPIKDEIFHREEDRKGQS